MDFSTKSIAGKIVRLETLSHEHIVGLCECLMGEPDGWFARMYGINSAEILTNALENRLKMNESQASRTFVTVDLKTSKAAGISHFMKVDRSNRQLEIGGTQVVRAQFS